jgi:hypothetical protein
VDELPQYAPIGSSHNKNDTKIYAIFIIIIFIIFAFNILRLWMVYIPQMERVAEVEEETAELISGGSGGATVSIVNIDIIPQIRIFFMLTLISFGILDGVFSVMLLKGNPRKEHEMLIMPFFILYLINRIASGFIITFLTPAALVGNNPRGILNSLYVALFVFSILSTVIILLFHTKIFTKEKKKAFKILVARSE